MSDVPGWAYAAIVVRIHIARLECLAYLLHEHSLFYSTLFGGVSLCNTVCRDMRDATHDTIHERNATD